MAKEYPNLTPAEQKWMQKFDEDAKIFKPFTARQLEKRRALNQQEKPNG